MMSFANSAEWRYYTFVSWASRENPQTGVKAQDHSSTTKSKRAQQVLTCLTCKFTSSTQMGVGHQKIGRKTADLCG
jgi:hypothetical protein